MDIAWITTKIVSLLVQRTNICSIMLRLIVLLTCVSCVYSTVKPDNQVRCGPDELCICEGKLEMDCINSDLQLNRICEYISNTTDFDIAVLRVKSSYIHVLKGNDLRGCENLLEIYLSGNGISEIENNAFDKFKRLNTLDISNNSINLYDSSENSSSMIHFPESLKVLSLWGNYDMKMYDNLSYPNLSNLVDLHTLVIDGLPLTNFKTTYKSLRCLYNVTMSGFLSHCNISYVSNETFIHLVNVHYLNISACNITGVDAFGFGTLDNLEILDLSWNMRLGFSALRNISYGLQYTDIRIINIAKIHPTFGPGTQIRLEDVCYLWNTSLNEIDISRNRLEMFEKNALMMIPKSLNIARAEYNKFAMEAYLIQLGCLTNLTELYLSFQFATYNPLLFDKEYQGIVDRDYNDQEHCPFLVERLTRNDSSCPYFKPGEKIIITNYLQASKLPQNMKKMEITQSGLMYDIDDLSMVIPSDTLEYADLSGNVLHSWRGPLQNFTKIKHFYLSKNYCSYVTKHFFQFAKTSLENLQLDNNYLGLVLNDETIGPFFLNDLSELKILNLSYNIISYIPRNLLLGSHKIETLDLSVNNIEEFTLDVSNLSLLHLILHNNFLQSLPHELRKRLEENSKQRGKMFTVDLRNNTINVNCESKDYLKWLVSYEDHMIGFHDYIFVDSNGKRITSDDFKTEVYNLDARCRSYTLIIVVCVIFISVFLALAIAGFIYKNRWNLRYILRNAKFKHFRYKKINGNTECQYRYDVFVSYANENSDFIRDELYPKLEQKDLRVCLHEKHFLPGNNIADNILEAISDSRKTLVILSNDYVDSKWCMYEFNMARMESIYDRDGSSCLCMVLLEDVATKKMPNEMLQWLRRNTYIEYTNDEQGEIWFWENLARAVCGEM